MKWRGSSYVGDWRKPKRHADSVFQLGCVLSLLLMVALIYFLFYGASWVRP
jgi:hypothetical protein